MNTKYNSSVTIDRAGLGYDAVIVLEEQIGGPDGGEWISDASRQNSGRLSGALPVVGAAHQEGDGGL